MFLNFGKLLENFDPQRLKKIDPLPFLTYVHKSYRLVALQVGIFSVGNTDFSNNHLQRAEKSFPFNFKIPYTPPGVKFVSPLQM